MSILLTLFRSRSRSRTFPSKGTERISSFLVWLKVNTPFIKAVFNGNLSFRQENIKTPEIRFHNAELTIHPIALGIKKWIRNWEKTKRISLKRKGPAVIMKLNGSLNRLDLNSLKNITIF